MFLAEIFLIFILACVRSGRSSESESNQKMFQSSLESTLMKYFDVKEEEVSFLVKSVRYDFEKQIAIFDIEAVLPLETLLRTDEISAEKQKQKQAKKVKRCAFNGTDVLSPENNEPGENLPLADNTVKPPFFVKNSLIENHE